MYVYCSFCVVCSVVPVCEASVMIAVSAEHRKEAIAAVTYAIDTVKSTATIWKKVTDQRIFSCSVLCISG